MEIYSFEQIIIHWNKYLLINQINEQVHTAVNKFYKNSLILSFEILFPIIFYFFFDNKHLQMIHSQ